MAKKMASIVVFLAVFLWQVQLTILQGPLLVRVIPRNISQLEFLQTLPTTKRKDILMQVWRKADQLKRHSDIWVTNKSYEKLSVLFQKRNLTAEILCDDIYNATDDKKISMRDIEKFDEKYQSLENIYGELKRLSVIYSNHSTLESIGKSYEKRDLYSMKIQSDKNSSKRIIFVNCGSHSREWLAISSCVYILRRILFDLKYDAGIQALLNKYDVIVVPILNPDGYRYSRRTRYRMWRKSRSETSTARCRGVDINRNFNYRWGGAGSSPDACEPIFCGREPFSEKESLFLARYMYRIRRKISAFIDVHTFGQLLMHPWGFTSAPSKHIDIQVETLKEIQAALKSEQNIEYKVGSSSSVLYFTSGDALDWVYGRLGIIHTYGVELRPSFDDKNGFRITHYAIKPTGEDMLVILKTLVKSITDKDNAQ